MMERMERMENDRTTKRVYVRECAGSRSVGRLRKRWINTVKECLRKRGFNVRQARRMVHDMSVWRGFVSYHSYMTPLKGEIPSVAKATT